jgi:hypothetical protein
LLDLILARKLVNELLLGMVIEEPDVLPLLKVVCLLDEALEG